METSKLIKMREAVSVPLLLFTTSCHRHQSVVLTLLSNIAAVILPISRNFIFKTPFVIAVRTSS